MKKLILLLIFLVSLSTAAFGKIVEAAHFSDILKHVQDNSLVILDIDDTLLLPVQTLGTDVWYQARLKKYEAMGDKEWALDKALAEWEAVRHLTGVKAVEEGTDQIIEQLQQRKITVMALTTQGLTLATRTCNQLRSLHIDMTKTPPSDRDHYFMNGKGVLYRQGVLFTSGSPKGQALLKLLELAAFVPKHVVFINDKATHLKEVEASLLAQGIPFIGLRYSYGDARVASYRPEIAQVQWENSTFFHILSDEEAEAILFCRSNTL